MLVINNLKTTRVIEFGIEMFMNFTIASDSTCHFLDTFCPYKSNVLVLDVSLWVLAFRG